MEPIDIVVNGEVFRALPMPGGTFEIFKDEGHLGCITPILVNPMFIQWEATSGFNTALAQQIGEAIETKENF